jgi:hypothetical protein
MSQSSSLDFSTTMSLLVFILFLKIIRKLQLLPYDKIDDDDEKKSFHFDEQMSRYALIFFPSKHFRHFTFLVYYYLFFTFLHTFSTTSTFLFLYGDDDNDDVWWWVERDCVTR